MTSALALTGSDLIRALGDATALAAVDQAVRARADALAGELAGATVVTRVLKRGAGDYVVTVAGADVFTREFGSQNAEPAPVIAGAIARVGGT